MASRIGPAVVGVEGVTEFGMPTGGPAGLLAGPGVPGSRKVNEKNVCGWSSAHLAVTTDAAHVGMAIFLTSGGRGRKYGRPVC